MVEFYSPESVKSNAVKRNNRLRNLALLVEVVVGLILLVLLLPISWSITTIRVPIMAELHALGYLKELAGSVFRFNNYSVFILCNLIIILVVIESSSSLLSSKQISGPQKQTFDFVEDPLSWRTCKPVVKKTTEQAEAAGDVTVVKQRVPLAEESVAGVPEGAQIYRRTMSASYARGGGGVEKKNKNAEAEPPAQRASVLRRSKTVKWGQGSNKVDDDKFGGNYGLVPDPDHQGFEDLSHDEFRSKIEAFIAKQQRMIREESLAAVVGRSNSDVCRSRRRL